MRRRVVFPRGWKGRERKSEERKCLEVKGREVNGVHLSCRWAGIRIIGSGYENSNWAQKAPTLEIFPRGGTHSGTSVIGTLDKPHGRTHRAASVFSRRRAGPGVAVTHNRLLHSSLLSVVSCLSFLLSGNWDTSNHSVPGGFRSVAGRT